MLDACPTNVASKRILRPASAHFRHLQVPIGTNLLAEAPTPARVLLPRPQRLAPTIKLFVHLVAIGFVVDRTKHQADSNQ